jgi:dolichyl-phosphate beta-glucosyltransferase
VLRSSPRQLALKRPYVIDGGKCGDGVNETNLPRDRDATAPSLSLVIPAYNESARIRQTIETAWTYLHDRPYPTELILIDDGSTDDTAAIASAFAANHDRVRVLTIPHGGKAAALRAGLLAGSGDVVAFSDADLATPLEYLEAFRRAILDGDDVVIGSREGVGAKRIDEPAYRHLMGRVFNLIVRLLVLPGIQDTQCGFKMFRREAAQAILDRARLYRRTDAPLKGPRVTAFDVELLVVARQLGLRTTSIPVVWTYGNRSTVNPFRDTLTNFGDVIRVKWHQVRGRYG